MLAWEAGSRPTRSGVYTWFILVIVNGAKLRETGCPSPRLDYSGQIAAELQGQSLSLAVFCSIFSLSSWRQARTKLVGILYRLYPNLLQVADVSLRAWKLKRHCFLPPTKWNKKPRPMWTETSNVCMNDSEEEGHGLERHYKDGNHRQHLHWIEQLIFLWVLKLDTFGCWIFSLFSWTQGS